MFSLYQRLDPARYRSTNEHEARLRVIRSLLPKAQRFSEATKFLAFQRMRLDEMSDVNKAKQGEIHNCASL